MRGKTWKQWVRACVKDPSSPSELGKGSLAALTGQDVKALDAIAACWALYAGDLDAREGALAAVRALLPAMLPENRWIARELIPFALDWNDRERLWPLVQSPTADFGRAMSAQATAVEGVLTLIWWRTGTAWTPVIADKSAVEEMRAKIRKRFRGLGGARGVETLVKHYAEASNERA